MKLHFVALSCFWMIPAVLASMNSTAIQGNSTNLNGTKATLSNETSNPITAEKGNTSLPLATKPRKKCTSRRVALNKFKSLHKCKPKGSKDAKAAPLASQTSSPIYPTPNVQIPLGGKKIQLPSDPQNSTTPPIASLIGPSDSSPFNAECLTLHNQKRAKIGVVPLTFSKQVADYAQSWSQKMADQQSMTHSGGPYGENLYTSSNTRSDCGSAVNSWWDEIKDYAGEKVGSSTKKVGHFTQMAWPTTTQIGCGLTVAKSGSTWISCNYNPRGNIVGVALEKYKEN